MVGKKIPSLIRRANIFSSPGETVIGGSYQKGDWNSEIDEDLSARMLARAVKLCPELTDGKGPEALEVVRHTVGLRPVRKDGPRIEKEKVRDVWVVHNYGHGGYGCKSPKQFCLCFLLTCR